MIPIAFSHIMAQRHSGLAFAKLSMALGWLIPVVQSQTRNSYRNLESENGFILFVCAVRMYELQQPRYFDSTHRFSMSSPILATTTLMSGNTLSTLFTPTRPAA